MPDMYTLKRMIKCGALRNVRKRQIIYSVNVLYIDLKGTDLIFALESPNEKPNFTDFTLGVSNGEFKYRTEKIQEPKNLDALTGYNESKITCIVFWGVHYFCEINRAPV